MAIVGLDTISEENYIMQYGTEQLLLWCKVEGRDLVYKDMEGLCAEGVVFGRFIRSHASSVTYLMKSQMKHDFV